MEISNHLFSRLRKVLLELGVKPDLSEVLSGNGKDHLAKIKTLIENVRSYLKRNPDKREILVDNGYRKFLILRDRPELISQYLIKEAKTSPRGQVVKGSRESSTTKKESKITREESPEKKKESKITREESPKKTLGSQATKIGAEELDEWKYYFPDISENSPALLAHFKRLELNPQNFELAASTDMKIYDVTEEELEKYKKVPDYFATEKEYIQNVALRNNHSLQRDNLKQKLPQNLGWSRENLYNAIRNSGLIPELKGRPATFNDLGIKSENPDQLLPGQRNVEYYPRRYYETIYRDFIYNNVDPKTWCKPNIPIEALRFAVHIRKNLSEAEVSSMSREKLCDILLK